MIDLGIVRPGTTLYIPFQTFSSDDPSASMTLTGLATTDIEIYKDGSATQRASDSGYALLDTDGIDFDGITGIHGFSVDLADNTTAGFYAAGSQYWIVVSSVTVDAATINFVAATFRIGYPAAILNTTIATLSSQTSFTLTAGPAEDDALNGMELVIHDVASAVQMGRAVILDYTGSTKTVTLAAGTTFAAAASDNVAVIGPSPLQPTASGNRLDVTATGAAGVDWNNVENPTTVVGLSGTTVKTATDVETDTADIQSRLPAALVSGRMDSNMQAAANGVITAAVIATDAIDADAIAANAVTEIQSGLATAANLSTVAGYLDTEIAAILADTNELQTDWTDGGRLDTLLDNILADTGTSLPSTLGTPSDTDLATDINNIQDAVAAVFRVQALAYGVATSASSNTVVFAADGVYNLSIPSSNDLPNNCWVAIVGGTGRGQARMILDYAYSAGSATVTTDSVWTTNPIGGSVIAIVPAAKSPGTYGDTVQTGDSYAIVNSGTHGNAALKTLIDTVDDLLDTEVAAIKAKTDNLPNDPADASDIAAAIADLPTNAELATALAAADDAVLAAIAALNNLSAAQVNAEVVDALATDTYAEPGQGAPSATTSLAAKLNYLYKWMRNKKDNTGSENRFYADNGTTVDQKQTTAESGGTVTVGEMATGA